MFKKSLQKPKYIPTSNWTFSINMYIVTPSVRNKSFKLKNIKAFAQVVNVLQLRI